MDVLIFTLAGSMSIIGGLAWTGIYLTHYPWGFYVFMLSVVPLTWTLSAMRSTD